MSSKGNSRKRKDSNNSDYDPRTEKRKASSKNMLKKRAIALKADESSFVRKTKARI